MKCPNCGNSALEESHKFCFECSYNLQQITSCDAFAEEDGEKNKQSESFDLGTEDTVDEIQRKRKVEGHDEEPTKRKSVETDTVQPSDGSKPAKADPADNAAYPLQNLALPMNAEDTQQQILTTKETARPSDHLRPATTQVLAHGSGIETLDKEILRESENVGDEDGSSSISAVVIEVSPPSVDQSSAPSESSGQSLDHDMEQGGSREDAAPGIPEDEESSANETTRTLSDESQRKRNVERHDEEMTKRKSVETDTVQPSDGSKPAKVNPADNAAYALQNLALPMDTEDSQQHVFTTNEMARPSDQLRPATTQVLAHGNGKEKLEKKILRKSEKVGDGDGSGNISAVLIGVSPPSVDQSSAPSESSGQSLDHDMEQGDSREDATPGIPDHEDGESSANETTRTLSDESQRKRNVEGHDEEPAKRKSVETDTVQPSDGSTPAKVNPADNAAYALQNLALPMNTEDPQQQVLDTQKTARPSDGDGSGSISAVLIGVSPPSVDQSSAPSESSGQSLDHDREQGDSREDATPGIPDHEDGESSANETTRTMSDKPSSSEDLPYTDLESSQDVNRAVEEVASTDVGENGEDEEYDSKDEDEDESDSQCKDTASVGGTGKTKQGKPKRNKIAIKSKREKKAEQRKKNENEAKQSNRNERGSARPSDVDRAVSSIPGGKGPTKGTNNASEEQEKTGKEKGQEYFCKDNRPKITLVFHAVLDPHFKFEKNLGDKVVMRFGGPAFGDFSENVVELQFKRCLQNDYLLFNGELRAPVALVHRRVLYKYVVVRKGREKNEKDKFLWEHIDTGGQQNRCLVIPEGRRQAETVWHQYDDTIFGTPSWVQSMRSKLPFWKSMDPTEGRIIATLCMLPQWEGFVVGDGDRQITAWEAIERVKDVAYCMTQTLLEDHKQFRLNVPRGYHFDKVLKDFLKPKVERNALLLTSTTDDGETISVLVSSLAIAHVVVHHKVQLDNDCYRSLLQCLIHWSEPQKQKCTDFETLLKYFPGEHLRTLGESLLSICRQMAKDHFDFQDWLFVVPLAHFLTGQSEPFSNSRLPTDAVKEKEEIWSGSKELETKAVRNKLEKETPRKPDNVGDGNRSGSISAVLIGVSPPSTDQSSAPSESFGQSLDHDVEQGGSREDALSKIPEDEESSANETTTTLPDKQSSDEDQPYTDAKSAQYIDRAVKEGPPSDTGENREDEEYDSKDEDEEERHSECKDTASGGGTGKTKQGKPKRNKSAIKSKREKKAERKKKKARQSNKNERGSAKPSDVVRVVSSIPGGKGPDKGTNNASEKQEETGKEKREEYFCKDNRPKITLVFHAVLAPHFKFEEHQGDKVVMRFGGLEFGEFKEDVVELQLEKCLENNYLLFNGKLRAPVALVSRRVSYKYAVARKGRENNEDKFLWEHIDTGGPKNRCLVIPEGRRQAETVWHQYDDTIFSTPNLVQSMRNIIPFCKSMDPTEGRTIATLCMLPQWEGFVVADGDKQITAWDAIERVKDVAYCMTQTWMEENNIPKRNVPRRYHFDKVLKDFLQPKVERNASLRTSTTDDGEKILVLVSSLAIAHVVVHHKVQLDNDCYHSLLQCLILWSEPQKEKCTAFETLLEHFPGDYLGTLGQSLLSICRQRAKEHSDFHDWLLVVPLAHFLTGQSQPFNKSTLLVDVPKEKDELWWGSEGLDTKAVRNRTFGEHSPWSLIKMISPLFELDPLFRRTFLLVVPCREFGKIAASKMFPPAEVYASLARILSEEDHLIEEQRQVVATTLKELLKNTQQAHQESTTSSSADAEILLRKSFLSATSCVHILKTIVSSCDLNLLLDCLGSISLWTAGLLRRTDADKAEKRESDLPVRDITQKTLDNVKKWLDKTLPRTMPCYDKTLVQRELQTWSKLFELCEKVDYCQEMWIPRLLEMLKGRLEQCDCNGLVELFSKTSMAECRNVVQDLVSESTYKKVEGMLESEGGNEQVFRNLSEQGLNSPQAKECGKLLTLMLTRCWPWPQGCDQTNPLGVLRHVLTWRLWPCFLQRFGRESDYRLVLKPDGQGILMMAITSLEATVGDLKSGNIEFQVLRLLLDQPDRFLELCDHIAGKRGQKTPLKGILERRRIELKAFLEERENVSNFVKMCAFLKRVDVDGLSKKSIQEAFRLSINELAQSEIVKGEFVPRVTFFGLTEKEKYMISHLVKLRDSVLLRTFWCENGTKALIKIAKREPPQTMLNVNDVSELVWEPSINVLSVIQDAFVSGSISFRDIDKYFGIFKGGNRYDDLNRELEHATCSNDTLQRRIQQVRQYDKIQHCIDAAKNIWDFKEALHLKGNFQLVDELRNQLNDEFKERALDSMNQSLERTTQLLGKVTPKRAECLAAVVLCKPLVDWLRTAVGGHQELMTLVDLAWLSAGETPMEHAKIACFHTSCLGFAPLIFDVKSNFGFDEVMKACEAVWNAVDSDPQLPNKLIQTSLQQGWWEGVRTSLGSVATSSLEEAKVINERGLYHVGCPDWPEGTSAVSGRTLNHVIRVTVPSETNGDSKKFGLDDLKDLQSKLMLIAAKATHGKEDVDRFVEIFQGVLRLGTLYLALCEEGEASYLSWRQQFQSTPELVNRSLIDDLNNQGDAMEKCLQQWKKEMHTKRLQYSELNYFTTQQLLILRSHLASVLGRGPNAVDKLPLEVYTLLESVFPDIEPDALKSALINSGICLQPDTDFTRSFGAAGARRPEAISTQPLSPSDRLPSSFSSTKEQIFQSLVAKVDELNYSEEVALAAMIACGDVSEADLLLWCIKNGHNDELVSTYYSEGLNHPGYAHLVTKADDGPSEEETYHSDESDMPYLSDTVESMEVAVTYDQTAGGKYLSLDELGSLLMRLHSQGPRKQRRRFPEYLKRGRPNLVVVPGDDVLGTVLSLYMYDKSHALPSSEEVLICHTDTTAEEMELFWRRSLGDKDGRLFCLVHADVVDFNVAQKAANALEFLLQEPHYNRNEGLCLIIICSSENEDRAYIVAALDQYRLSTVPRCASSKDIRQYFKEQFKSRSPTDTWFRGRSLPWTAAAELDQEKLSVRVVSSETAGAGKSLVVRRLSERLLDLENNDVVTHYPKEMDAPLALCVTVPVYGPVVNQRSVVKALLPHSIAPNLPLSRIFHLDIHPSATVGLDTFLFNLLVLGVLTSTSGQVWRRRSSDLFVIEITSATMDKRNGKEEPMTRLPLTSKRATSQPFYCLLPTIHCVTPRQTLLQLRNQQMVDASLNPLFDDAEFRSTYVQRAFQYLKLWEAGQCLDNFQFVPGLVMGDHAECLKTLMSNCGIFDPSWAELRYFVNFLNSQLHACEESSFCDTNLVGDTLVGFRTFVVQFMILMSRDFATPSLSGNNAAQGEENHFVIGDDIPNAENNVEVEMAELSLRRRWETSSHPYIFFNYDRITMTFMGFHIDRDGNLIDPDLRVVIERNLMSRHLRTGLFVQRVDMETNYESWSKGDKIEKLCAVMGVEWPYDPDGSYELTTDNLKKILAIHMRFRSGIPVVIMGETGCGKTRLIRYMCGLQSGPGGPKNMLLMKVHGGTSCEDILKKVEQAEEIARLNDPQGVDTVLFFDEANTTDALGMIKEVMVDRKVNGRQIGVGLKRLQFIAACNPYRKHTEEMIDKLESAGLGYHVNTQDTRDRIGRIPLRHLVYRVHALPESMRPLVWDFGQLNPEIEELYTRQIVSRFIIEKQKLPGGQPVVNVVTAVLTASQRYMRSQTEECSFVSLRDVERAMNVMVWFYSHRGVLNPLMDNIDEDDADTSDDEDSDDNDEDGVEDEEEDELDQPIDDVTRALVLSLGVCYHARLQDREPYSVAVAQSFDNPCTLVGGHRRILQEITRCQQAVLNELELGPNIGRNTALSENVFMMVVCIELRIPLFVIGKPGSSKSLAKTVVADNMQGDASQSDLFKTFKQAHMVSYQCSPLSTAEGIMATFRQCGELQKEKNLDKYVSVVVLDEVGLAEDSPLMPLKTLHPLLEDGVAADDDIMEVENRPSERVAFIGISNWALDPSKMNRGIMLSRTLPDMEELVESAMGICSTDQQIQSLVAPLINPLAQGYSDLYKEQGQSPILQESKKDEFFGLRDFYSLVKMVYWVAEESRREPRWPEVEHAIRRNFGGLDEVDPVRIFKKRFVVERDRSERKNQNEDNNHTLTLIKASLKHPNTRGESRYLLVLTENYAALPVVQQELLKENEDPVVIFGSSFPKDQEYTQICRNINRIKVCMETGKTVILLNLESLYESLYDALNQYYVYAFGVKYVDLGFGTHRVKCRVHDKFRLIVLAERDVVYSEFPIPLINRLEKHYLVTSASLSARQKCVVKRLEDWVTQFSRVQTPLHQQRRKFSSGDAFVGYNENAAASVVLQVCNALEHDHEAMEFTTEGEMEEKIFRDSQELLLNCATPDAVARLPCSGLDQQADDLWTTYFRVQKHSSLTAFLTHVLSTNERREHEGLLIQVTTHSRLLSSNDLREVAEATLLRPARIACLSLQQFHTEQQFCSSVREFFGKLGGSEGLLLVQCDSGDLNFNLIACARHLLVDQRKMAEENFTENVGRDSLSFVHIVMIVQLPRRVGGCPMFVGFQGGRWLCVHIDELRPPTGQIPAIEFMVDRSVSELFDVSPVTAHRDVNEFEDEGSDNEMETSYAHVTSVADKVDVVSVLRSCVQAAVARIDDESSGSSRSTQRIQLMLQLLPENASGQTDWSFATILARRIHKLLQEKDIRAGTKASDWLRSEALRGTGIQENGTFRRALWQRLFSSVIPLLSEVVAFIDRDSNLDLAGDGDNWLTHLWLSLFQRDKIVDLQYDSFLSLESGTIRERVPLVTSGRDRHVFDCQFPFSWLLNERIDAMWRGACSVSANSHTPVLQCLQDAVKHSEVGDLLDEIRSDGYEEAAVLRYLHDFVHMVHKPTVPGEEKLVSQAIEIAAREMHARWSSGTEFALSLSLIHVVYDHIEQRLAHFTQLVQAQPNIVTSLLHVIPSDDSEMVLDAVALQLCLAQLEPKEEELDDRQTRQVWCNRVLSIRPSADNMINNPAQGGPKTAGILRDCRSLWERISAVRLFIEHTCSGRSACHQADIKNIFRLWRALGDETDFRTPQTMRVIEKFLVDCSEAVSKRYINFGVTSCPVCLEGFVDKDPVRIPCGHVICLVCMSQWIGKQKRCPVCKQDVPDDFTVAPSKRIKKAIQEHCDFRRRCNSFFMELVSTFCFGSLPGGQVMDSELFTMFLSYVINARSQTKHFSPFPEHGIDATPVVRSFLLKQLMRNRHKEVGEHVTRYLSRARGLTHDVDHMLQVCQLFVNCKEDALVGQYSRASDNLLVMIKLAQDLFEESAQHLTSSSLRPNRELDVVVLESVAKARYAMTLAAEFMFKSCTEHDNLTWRDIQIKSELRRLMECVRRTCYKTLSPVPRLYLLKHLVRRFGADSIQMLCKQKDCEWILPAESRDKQEEVKVPDRFVVYGECYRNIREAMAKTVLSGTQKELSKWVQSTVLDPVPRNVIVLLSEYREVTTCHAFTSPQRQLTAKAQACIKEFLIDERHLSAEARPLALQLLDNTQGAAYPALRAAQRRSALEQSLGEIVVHTAAVLHSINQTSVCEPLRLLIENPAILRNCYLPSMPDDNLEEAMASVTETGQWYQCPKGHPYYIGDCGRPVEVKVCPECKVNIGGRSYALSQGNTIAQRGDRTMTGHVLGDPIARPKVLAPERNLSSVVVAIVRVLLHSAMLEGASYHAQDIAYLVHPAVSLEALGRFLWDHLRFDVEALARGLGKSVDDAVLCMHMILAEMTARTLQQPPRMNVASGLNNKAARRNWETAFAGAVVTPVLRNLDERIQQALELLVADERLGNNPLMRQLYEVDVPSEDLTDTVPPTCPALWMYRTQVTLEHVSHTFQQEVTSSDPKRNQVLGEFLRQEHSLRAVRFLPDIVKLQRLLMEKFHRRIDRKEAEQMSLHTFFRKMSSDVEREEFRKLTASFKTAWNLVRLCLNQQGRLRPPSDLCEKIVDNMSPVAVLLPSTSGMGICSTALVYYLTCIHNEFNERYQNLTGGNVKDLVHVQMKDVTTSHLIAYDPERDLLPLILAQCNYSLEVGRGTLVQYNWDALERQLIDRFIRGRPLVDFKDQRFAFSRDVQLDSVFASVRTKIPQTPLNAAISRQIVGEFRSLTDICDVLHSLDIAIGFLSSAGGSPEMPLAQYLRCVLRMPQENNLRSLKAQQCCQLRHVISLWRLLSLERARTLINRGEDPFDQIIDTYKQVMSQTQMMKFSSAMRRVDLDLFVSEVLELILLNLKGDVSPGEEEMSLGDYIQWHLDNKGSEPVPGLEDLPPEVLLKHVVSAWQLSVELSESYHEKRDSAAA